MFSPDGRWVAYQLFGPRDTGVFVEPFPRTGAKSRIAPRGIHPLWSPNGKELFYMAGGLFFMVTIKPGQGFDFSTAVSIPRPFQDHGPTIARFYDMTPDARRFIGIVATVQGQAEPLTGINVVLNWHEELKQLVPLKK